jgi:hypothetical protein
MFLKRLSRGSRANSYAEEDFADRPRSQDQKYAQQDSPRQSALQHNTFPDSNSPVSDMAVGGHNHHGGLPHRSQMPAEPYSLRNGSHGALSVPPGLPVANSRQNSGAFESSAQQHKFEAIPDPLTRAFNEALRPHQDKIESLEGQLADLQAYAEQLEAQRSEFFTWIDKRGLRPGMFVYNSSHLY